MTTSVTVEANPAAPNNVVEVEVYDPSTDNTFNRTEYTMMPGTKQTFTTHGEGSINVRESTTHVILAPNPVDAIGAG